MKIDLKRDSQLPWTGERYVPQVTGEVQLEHVHRYLLAREYASGKDVLDIACGEGFGSAILAETARSVIGVDIALKVVKHASIRYQRNHITFRHGSCAQIPLDKSSVDLVVSFETIEHHDEHKAMMAEIRRVLRPQGLLIISSPDKKEYSILTNYCNPFHVRELFKEEFEDLIRANFKNLALISQRVVYGSAIIPETDAFKFTHYNIEDTGPEHRGLARPRYIIAIASDEAIPGLSGGMLEQTVEESQIIAIYASERQKQAESNARLTQLEDEITQLREDLKSQSSHSADKLRQLESALITARALSQSMIGSLSWRLTAPLRVIHNAVIGVLNRLRHCGKSPLSKLAGSLETAAKTGFDSNTHHHASLIRTSAFFDPETYAASEEARAQGLDPIVHYLLVGEGMGFRPSASFDPVYYRARYPDIAAWSGSRLIHYLKWGRPEGRRAISIADSLPLPVAGLKLNRPTILVLIHEASRTGAPILGWNVTRALSDRANVVVVLMREGELEEAFVEVAAAVVGPVAEEIFNPAEGASLARRLVEIYRPLYVIANSVETRALVPALVDEGAPTVALVHEFSSYTKPVGILQQFYEKAVEIVFSAEIVRHSSEIDYRFLKTRRTHVLPQGPSEVPSSKAPTRTVSEQQIREQLRPAGAEDDLVVVGMGFVNWRKGVDLFIATATCVLARQPQARVRFIWVGEGYRVADAVDVSSYLSEQVTRSHLGNRFRFMDAVEDVESIYKEADILFLSSRLDPLPNVSIDAVLRSIPVVCFSEASGMAEILASNDDTRELVVPHLDVAAAAELISTLAIDDEKLRRFGDAVREVGKSTFDMNAYVNAICELGERAREATEQMNADAAFILAEGAFDSALFLGARAPAVELAAAVREYSAVAAKIDYERVPVSGVYTRRPLAGFNPLTYALQCKGFDRRDHKDPLAHYLRAGRPEGPWAHSVLRVDSPPHSQNSAKHRDPTPLPALRVALHGHFHYTDHLDDFIRAIAVNTQHCQLILTTDSAEKALEIKAVCRERGLEPDVRTVQNRGRDIAPFLAVLEEAIGSYDLLGHVHGKRSQSTPNVDVDFGDRWRTFLWQHLLGSERPLVDIVREAFIEDSALGFVFPEDPFLIGWEGDLEIAQVLAARMDFRAPLPPSIDFPVGTMFWTRPEALAPILRLRLTMEDFPPEPLPTDGTVLHAIERLLPLIAENAGYQYATTHFAQFVR
jgi:glycosyltransferase involved in cell wall biosynthesis/SAM-dependent methyltransferase